jgi:hypothetical protein
MSGVITFPFVPGAGTGGVFAGIPTATLQQWLAEAQQALHELKVGKKTVTLSYSSGDGMKSASFSRTSAQQLMDHINELQRALGIGGVRRAIDVRFGG